mgnify:CR=1 FL=1
MVLRSTLVAFLLFAASAVAQNFPERPLRMIVPFSPGAGTDMLARIAARKLQDAWGQNMVVENRPGGGTINGVLVAAKSPADGYTYVMITPSFIINATGVRKLPYDSINDFAPVTLFASSPLLLVAHPSLPVKSVAALLALAKARPREITYASAGTGSPTHLGMEIFALKGSPMVHVPYKGAAPGIVDLLGGHVQVMMTTLAFVRPHVQRGRLHALGVSTLKRSSSMPDMPTVAEAGVPGFEYLGWYGMLAPAGTPRDIVMRLHDEFVRIVNTPDMRERFAADGAEAIGDTPEHFNAYLKQELARWSKVIKAAGTKID